MPGHDRLWERLLEFLNTWATATELEPGRVRVDFEASTGGGRAVQIMMTADEWNDTVSVMWGSFDDAARQVRERVLGLRPDERFLVHDHHELVPSTTEYLPVDPDFERLQQLARQHPEGIGRWVVLDDDGNVAEEFRPDRG